VKAREPNQPDAMVAGDQYTYVGLASAVRAIISYRTGKRDIENTLEFIHDLRERGYGPVSTPSGRLSKA
jgi:hypothetical protein